jgi:hypothetical protein
MPMYAIPFIGVDSEAKTMSLQRHMLERHVVMNGIVLASVTFNTKISCTHRHFKMNTLDESVFTSALATITYFRKY